MREYLQKQFYRSDMKMLIRFADWSPESPRPFTFVYQSGTNTDRMEVNCSDQGIVTIKYNGKFIENGAEICDCGVRVFKSYPHFAPGRLSVTRNYPQADPRYSDGSFNSINREQTTIEITDINDTSTTNTEVEEYVEQLKGEPGTSAYDYAKTKGYDQSEEQFAQDMAMAANATPKCNYASLTPFKTGDKFFGKEGTTIKDVWSKSMILTGVLANVNGTAVITINTPMVIDSILDIRGCFSLANSMGVYPIGNYFSYPISTTQNLTRNVFCATNGTNFSFNARLPISDVGVECVAIINLLYTI